MNTAIANISYWQPAAARVCIVATCARYGEEHMPDGRNAGVWVNWNKLAARAGFEDGATAKAHYEPLLNCDHGHGGGAPRKRQSPYDSKPKTLETEDGNKQYTHNPYDLEDGEV
ncbi:hypothetical protein F4824DRAFT_495869 [Ustulina deusta]|nr:hypothetical protein F4824DRAFT_495869 [Ustulina deusta]